MSYFHRKQTNTESGAHKTVTLRFTRDHSCFYLHVLRQTSFITQLERAHVSYFICAFKNHFKELQTNQDFRKRACTTIAALKYDVH